MHTPLLSIFVARRSFLIVVWAALLSSPAPAVHASGDPCIDNAVLGITPLTDMPPGSTYQGFPGGLYPDGNNPPDTWRAAALARAQTIRPLAADGTDDASNGRIVLLSVGMSNATQEYSNFVALAGADPRRDAHVLTVDGAQGGRDATDWIDPFVAASTGTCSLHMAKHCSTSGTTRSKCCSTGCRTPIPDGS